MVLWVMFFYMLIKRKFYHQLQKNKGGLKKFISFPQLIKNEGQGFTLPHIMQILCSFIFEKHNKPHNSAKSN